MPSKLLTDPKIIKLALNVQHSCIIFSSHELSIKNNIHSVFVLFFKFILMVVDAIFKYAVVPGLKMVGPVPVRASLDPMHSKDTYFGSHVPTSPIPLNFSDNTVFMTTIFNATTETPRTLGSFPSICALFPLQA